MNYIEKYNPAKTYYWQDGKIANYEAVKKLYPAIDNLTYIVYTDYTRNVIISMKMLNLVRTEKNISAELTENEAIAEILSQSNAIDGISNETRMADALEDLVALNMPDIE